MSPDYHRQDDAASVTSVSQQHLDDTKENMAPSVGAPAPVHLWPQFAEEVQGNANATCCSPRLEQHASLTCHARTARICVTPLQPLPVRDFWPSALLPVPSSSAMTQALSHPMTQQPGYVVNHTASESGNQPAADVCLFGSPPRDSSDMQRSVCSKARAIMEKQGDNVREGSRPAGGGQTPLYPQVGYLCGVTSQGEAAVGASSSQDMSSEKAFRQLLESAQQQRVSHALTVVCGECVHLWTCVYLLIPGKNFCSGAMTGDCRGCA